MMISERKPGCRRDETILEAIALAPIYQTRYLAVWSAVAAHKTNKEQNAREFDGPLVSIKILRDASTFSLFPAYSRTLW